MIVNAPTLGRKKKEKKKKTDVRGTIKPGPERYAVSRRMRKKRKKKSLIDRFYHFAQY